MEVHRFLGQLATRRVWRLLRPVRRRRAHRAERRVLKQEAKLPSPPPSWWADDPRWFPRGTPPREHNRVTPLVDGNCFFARLQDELARAEHYVYIAGWCLTPEIPLRRGDEDDTVRTRLSELLGDCSRRVPVRILLWGGAPFMLQPTLRTMEAVQQAIRSKARGDVQCRLDQTARVSHCHHQKAIVVDGRVAFVGGMDLTTYQGDRWDTPRHALRSGPNWHDVQLCLEGEVVADVEHNFRQRWTEVSGADDLTHRDPTTEPSWQTPVQIVRTIPANVYKFAPRGEFGIHHAYIRALRQARRLIYIENQYLWSPTVVKALIYAMNRPRDEPFRIVIVLPARAYEGKWDNDQHVAQLRDADRGRGIVSVYCPYASGPRAGLKPFYYRPIYVHAKVGIVDDEWLTVGSANLNTRGLATDSEINAVVRDGDVARNLRVRLWAEHLAMPADQVAATDPIDLVDHLWPERAATNARIIHEADRLLEGHIHRYEIGRMPGTWLLEEVESVAVEL